MPDDAGGSLGFRENVRRLHCGADSLSNCSPYFMPLSSQLSLTVLAARCGGLVEFQRGGRDPREMRCQVIGCFCVDNQTTWCKGFDGIVDLFGSDQKTWVSDSGILSRVWISESFNNDGRGSMRLGCSAVQANSGRGRRGLISGRCQGRAWINMGGSLRRRQWGRGSGVGSGSLCPVPVPGAGVFGVPDFFAACGLRLSSLHLGGPLRCSSSFC